MFLKRRVNMKTLYMGKGFTLVELLIVIAIIGILAGIAVPLYLGERTKAAQTEAKSNLEALRLLEEQFFADNGTYTGAFANTAAIKTALTGFKPGDELSLKFTYSILTSVDITGAAQTPCFTATATGKSGTNVSGNTFRIDCNNNRTF
jgi:type IV pilus assembly protein PilE